MHRSASRAVLLIAALLLSGCGGSSPTTAGSAAVPKAGGGKHHGSVSVLYAGSLEAVMNSRLGPAFEKATGYTFNGYPAGSKDLASEIRGKVRSGDVFISASPKVNQTLEGSAHGGWVSWYAPFASTGLVLGYNPNSNFAGALRSQPWYRVIRRPDLRLGLTDPRLDPKGVLAVAALDQAAAAYHEPALKRIAQSQSDLFPEQDLVGRLQSGQLDTGFFYTVEASAARIPTVSLAPVHESATYTITVLNHAPNPIGAAAFVRFLLGPQGRSLLRSAGLVNHTSAPVGSGLPSSLRRTLGGAG